MNRISRMLRRGAVLIAIAGFAALGLAGPRTVLAADQKPIVIGASISLTGAYADGGKYSLQGYELWVKEQNAKGGLLGRPIELKTYDDQSDPAVGVRLYEKLITEDHVDLLVGPYSSALTGPATNVAERHKMPIMTTEDAAASTFTRGYKYAFQGLPQAPRYVQSALDLAQARGLKKIAFVGEDTAFPHAIGASVPDSAKKMGFELVVNEYYPHNASDYASLAQKIKVSGAEAVIAVSYPPDSIGILRALKQVAYTPKVFYEAIGPSDPQFWQNAGPDANGILASSAWSATLKTPGNTEFVRDFTKEYGRGPDYHSASSFSGMMVLAEAVKRAGSLDQDKIRDNLAALHLQTLLGEYRVDPNTGLQVGYQMLLLQWQNGKQYVVAPDAFKQKSALYPFPGWSGAK